MSDVKLIENSGEIQPGCPEGPGLRPRPYARPDVKTALAAFGVSRLLIVVLAAGSYAVREPVLGLSFLTRQLWAQISEGFAAWDGSWYIAAATRGYGAAATNPDGQSTAPFFPLLPGGIKLLDAVGIPPAAAGLLITNAAFMIALVLLFRIAEHHGGEDFARRATWMAALSPFSFAFSMIYPDGIFMAASIGAFLAIRRARWWAVSGACVVAALVRPNGFVLAIAAAVAIWASTGDFRGRIRRLAPLSAVVVAVGGWLLLLMRWSGSAFAFSSAKAHWKELAMWDVFAATYHLLTGGRTGEPLSGGAVAHLLVGGAAVALLIKQRKVLERGWGVLCFLALLGPAVLGIVGLARYVSALFPVYIALAAQVKANSRTERWLLYAGGVALTVVIMGVFWSRLVP